MTMTVDQRSPAVELMANNWPVIAALMEGTVAMRAASKTYLPQQPREDDEDYKYRLSTATLFPALRRTVGVMAGKPFSKEVTLGKDTPEPIEKLAQDIDGEGRSLHSFSADLMQETVSFGFGGVLVDFTRTEGQARTLADERAMRARPYWVHIKHDQILGWKAERVGDQLVLTQLRFKESKEEPDGEFGTVIIPRVRVLTPGAWQVWEKRGQDKEYKLAESGTTTLDVIPFVPFYGIRAGFMIGLPPLLDLAFMNVEHWQESSDQKDSVRFARKRLLVLLGLDDEKQLTAGSSYALKMPQGADAKIVQGSAESVTVGRAEIDSLEERMIQTGAELLVAKPGERSATEASNDAEANKSELQRIVESFEDSIDQCLQLTAKWLKLEEGGHASLYKDFAAGSLSEATAQLLLSLQQGGIITKGRVIRENQRRGVLAADIDPDDELAAVAEEGPPLGTLPGPGNVGQ